MTVSITYFVHGTTTDNEKGLATGWNQGELSETGKQQAVKLGELTSGENFDVVFCSDLKRAVDSANLAFGKKYKIITDKRLRECNYGERSGLSSIKPDEMKAHVDQPFPGGESYRDVEKRVVEFVEFLKNNFSGKHVATVAHQGPQLALEVICNHLSWTDAITSDWRRVGKWQPGWKYIIN
ncbi:MAG: histidine phosphatase family protein [Candidatus Magasanikbacteria bacterium]